MATIEELILRLRAKGLSDLKAVQTAIKNVDLQVKQGTIGKGEAEKRYKALATEVRNLKVGSDKLVGVETQLFHASNRNAVGFKSMATAQMQVVTATNRMTISLNRAHTANMNLGRVIQDMPFGMMGIANNIPVLVESLGRMEVQVDATGKSIGKLRQIMRSLAGAGGLMMLTSAVSALMIWGPQIIDFFSGGADAAKKMREELKKQNDELLKNLELQEKLGLLGPGAARRAAERQHAKALIAILDLQTELVMIEEEKPKARLRMEQTVGTRQHNIMKQRLQELEDREKEIGEMLDPDKTGTVAHSRLLAEKTLIGYYEEQNKKLDTQKKTQGEIFQGRIDELAAIRLAQEAETRAFDELDISRARSDEDFNAALKIMQDAEREKQKPFGAVPAPLALGLPGAKLGVQMQDMEKKMAKVKQTGFDFTKQMQGGFAAATNTLADGFIRAFGLGQGLLDRMIATILGSLAQTGIAYLTSLIFSPAKAVEEVFSAQHGGVIPEPVVGLGKSGRMYTFGEAGPEYVTPHASQSLAFGALAGQVDAMGQAISDGTWRIRGTDIVYTYDRNNRILSKRRT